MQTRLLRPRAPIVIRLTATIALLHLACAPATPAFYEPEIPEPLATIITGSDAIEIGPNDPMFAVEPGTVVDDLAGLHGCWAAYRIHTAPPDSTDPPPGTPTWETYEFFSFDTATGQAICQTYARMLTQAFATARSQEGTFSLAGANRLLFQVTTTRTSDPITGKTYTLPADLEQMFADYLAIGLPYDAQQQQALRNQFSSPETLTYLATRDGDRVKLAPVQTTAGNDETADAEGAMIYARITCPE